jgi:hypothetical protein
VEVVAIMAYNYWDPSESSLIVITMDSTKNMIELLDVFPFLSKLFGRTRI